jgi:hypothetical protein
MPLVTVVCEIFVKSYMMMCVVLYCRISKITSSKLQWKAKPFTFNHIHSTFFHPLSLKYMFWFCLKGANITSKKKEKRSLSETKILPIHSIAFRFSFLFCLFVGVFFYFFWWRHWRISFYFDQKCNNMKSVLLHTFVVLSEIS